MREPTSSRDEKPTLMRPDTPKTDDVTPCLTAALAYAARGWPVLPCNGKVPVTAHGVKDASTDAATIRAWWRATPTANVAILAGERSGLLVVDVDPRNGGLESFAALPAVPATLKSLTGDHSGKRGMHLYFERGAGLRGGKLGPGLDVKGAAGDGYVIAPPPRSTLPASTTNGFRRSTTCCPCLRGLSSG